LEGRDSAELNGLPEKYSARLAMGKDAEKSIPGSESEGELGRDLPENARAALESRLADKLSERPDAATARSDKVVESVEQPSVDTEKRRFMPICKVCGERHWPFHPLIPCVNKKKALAKGKAQAKAEAKAKANEKAQAKAAAKARRKAEKKAYPQMLAKAKAEAQARAEAEAQAREHAKARAEAQPRADEESIAKFERLVAEWKADTKFVGTVLEMATHPAYQQIIGMGQPAVPLILQRLAAKGEHWFWALRAITGENPVPKTSRGNIEQMTEAWLSWGRAKGHEC
jgi:flagellar biosynthesis GTPase FlhF